MVTGLIIGLAVAGIGAILSLVVRDFQILFAISAAAGGISLVMVSILRNAAFIMKRDERKNRNESQSSAREVDNWSNAIMLFGLPNIIIAIILYFRLFRR